MVRSDDERREDARTTRAQGTKEGDNAALTLTELLRTLAKHWITAVVTAAIVLAGVITYLAVAPAKYSATSRLFATYSSTNNTENYSSLNSAGSYISTQVKSYPDLVVTKAVLAPVVEQLHYQGTMQSLQSMVSASNPTDTAFINISATTDDPQLSADIANACAESLKKLVETSLYPADQQSPVTISIVQPAVIPSAPSAPKKNLIIVLGIAVAIVLGVIAALLKNLFTRKIQDEEELSNYIDAPVLGRIPEDTTLDDTVPVIKQPGSSLSEKYRRVCTNLSFIAPAAGTHARLIVISAVGVNEGKTTTSVNVAAALAESGASVLLIDADLRHPSVAKKLGIDGAAGLAHILSGQASVKDVVQHYWKPNLHVLVAGPKPPNAATLLGSPLMTELLTQALHQYDYVIVDTAPMIVANDAASFAKQGGGLVLVSKRGATMKHELADVAAELANLNVPVTGFVANFARENKKLLEGSSYYYYYYYRDGESSDGSAKRKHRRKHKQVQSNRT
ncbi:polysaccharide biosynthesis tyrosine autokinase [Bifidobacterium gallicum]|uniref:non-specific protein-tyrosine kinase n=1 Tax=Bifidobacterium gallicum DSM 20093 = LMG 11596 TaxID=561180 RepID=D1NRU2_9BIFI|nr:polysaccharide biosynthesis tyrosine autokinase [Bifidobacterium gallicum]EFA23931.1 chain length determinant protein [Bifidobacterium gallicum DSM 20093 = LMG 11596]KFI59093.1 Etk tyrosine kinase [Bifidobacterium gallicum DSM 20093 = LMG 11596]